MPYITREDGERFVIPSYRDTLSAKKVGLLKRDLIMLSASYGEYATLQKRGVTEYEVAFSPDSGFLLGESIWNFFKRPLDMVYCEIIPNTTEAILVIVKGGSVYLDGKFPVDAIPEELIVFKTQQIKFDIYVYGNVPIGQTEEKGKFVFDPASIKSFTVLPSPVFPTLPTMKSLQLQLVAVVLKEHGIGVLPVKQIAMGLAALFIIWLGWEFISLKKSEVPPPPPPVAPVNPLKPYEDALTSPDPGKEIDNLSEKIKLLFGLPGWTIDAIEFTGGSQEVMRISVKSAGTRMQVLQEWVDAHHFTTDIKPEGVFIGLLSSQANRRAPTKSTSLQVVLATLIDRLSYVLPGNNLQLGSISDQGGYKQVPLTLNVNSITPFTLSLIGDELQDLPLVLSKASLRMSEGTLSGSIYLNALGN